MEGLFTNMLLSGLFRKRLFVTILAILTVSLLLGQSSPQGSLPHVEATFHAAAPRTVEELTERSIVRDYGSAWESLNDALSSNSIGRLDAYFVGPAKTDLASAITHQQESGIRSHYLKQGHKLEAV